MTSLDDELALFESEISSLATGSGETAPPDPSPPVIQSQPMGTPATHSTIMAPPIIGVPMIRPSMSSLVAPPFMPAQLRPPPGMMPPPMPPPMFVPNGVFVPQQMRMPPTFRPHAQPVAATIESGPSIYKDEANTQSNGNVPTQVRIQALAADVLAMEAKKAADSLKTAQSTSSGGGGKADKRPKKFVRSGGGQVWEDPSLAEWDTNDFRIFCGDLGNEVSDELLAKAFRKYPSFQRAKVVRDSRSNKSKGYGFVSFQDAEDYARAMREMDGKYVGNRPIKLRKSNWKDRQLDVIKRKQKQKEKLGLWS